MKVIRSGKPYVHIVECRTLDTFKAAGSINCDLVIIDTAVVSGGLLDVIVEHFNKIPLVFISDTIEFTGRIVFGGGMSLVPTAWQDEQIWNVLNSIHGKVETDRGGFLTIKWNKVTYHLEIDQIVYIDHSSRVSCVHMLETKYFVTMKLDKIQEQLPDCFSRCHKSYLVNMNYIHSVKDLTIYLKTNEEVYISRSCKDSFRMDWDRFARMYMESNSQ